MTTKTTQSAKTKPSFLILTGSFCLLTLAAIYLIYNQNSKNQESYYMSTSSSTNGDSSSNNPCTTISTLNSQAINLYNLLKCKSTSKGDCKLVTAIQKNINTLAKNNNCSATSITPVPTSNQTPGEGGSQSITPLPTQACNSEGIIETQSGCCAGLSYAQECNSPDSKGKCPDSNIFLRCEGAAYCIKCGDGVCSTNENKCNCPSDCK